MQQTPEDALPRDQTRPSSGPPAVHDQDIKYLIPPFKAIFSDLDFGFSKNVPDGYRIILEKINRQPEEVIFIDDSPDNVEAAESIGISGIIYQNNQQLLAELDKNLI